MRSLDIEITKAQLVRFGVEIKDDKPVVNATLALLTEQGRKITEYAISTNSWNKDTKFDFPIEAVEPIKEIISILERVATRHCKDQNLALPEGEKKEDPTIPF